MNRISRESQQLGKGTELDDSSDSFGRTHRSDVLSMKSERSAMEDLFSGDVGKHDYDWLLTPPGTPLLSSDTAKHHFSSTAPRSSSNLRSVSAAKASRFSTSQSENGHSTKPVRTSSTLCPSISNTYCSSSVSNYSRTSVLNTSTASVTSKPSNLHSRPSSRNTSSASVSTCRPSTPSRRLTAPPLSRTVTAVSHLPSPSSTPAKTRPMSTPPGEKPKPLQNSRPPTPTALPKNPTHSNSNSNSNTFPARSNSRSSTPICQTPSHPSSPAQKARVPSQPPSMPPSLRSKLSDRPVSNGKQRSVTVSNTKANSNPGVAVRASPSCRQSSLPVTGRGRLSENSSKARAKSNGHEVSPLEIKKAAASEARVQKPIKPASGTESTGFGRTISKKSLDMAVRHMYIRQSIGGIHGASVFPQSIRSAAPKGWPTCSSNPGGLTINSRIISENSSGNKMITQDCNAALTGNAYGRAECLQEENLALKASQSDICRSYRYDAMLLKEDSKNMNWLHGREDKFDQSLVFDHQFEPLAEPFILL